MNYHRQSGFKRGKTIWSNNFPVPSEALCFDESDFHGWLSTSGDLWWISRDAGLIVGANGELIAFFPSCINHPGPWHGYPISPKYDPDYEIPEEIVRMWEEENIVDELIAGRIRKGKI